MHTWIHDSACWWHTKEWKFLLPSYLVPSSNLRCAASSSWLTSLKHVFVCRMRGLFVFASGEYISEKVRYQRWLSHLSNCSYWPFSLEKKKFWFNTYELDTNLIRLFFSSFCEWWFIRPGGLNAVSCFRATDGCTSVGETASLWMVLIPTQKKYFFFAHIDRALFYTQTQAWVSQV